MSEIFEGGAIRAVTFDAGGTLVEPWPSVGAVYAEGIRRLGVGNADPALLNSRFSSVWAERQAFDYSRPAWRELVGRVLEGIVPAMEVLRVFEHLWVQFTAPDAWRVFPDVAPCLVALRKRGIRLAVVSNWDERLHSVLGNLGLAEPFEFVLPSVEVDAPKPDPRIFRAAAARFGLSPEVILHVGDGLREDVVGAQAAGFAARWLCRDGTRLKREIAGRYDPWWSCPPFGATLNWRQSLQRTEIEGRDSVPAAAALAYDVGKQPLYRCVAR